MPTITILLVLLLSAQSLACPSHKRVTKGDVIECPGHFFNDNTESQIRKDVRDNELRKEQIKLKDFQIKTLSKDRDEWKEEAGNQSEARHKMDSDLTKGFLGGVGLTILIIFAAGRVSK